MLQARMPVSRQTAPLPQARDQNNTILAWNSARTVGYIFAQFQTCIAQSIAEDWLTRMTDGAKEVSWYSEFVIILLVREN